MTDLEESKLSSIILAAGLRAVKENGFTIQLPLKFVIEEEAYSSRIGILQDAPKKK